MKTTILCMALGLGALSAREVQAAGSDSAAMVAAEISVQARLDGEQQARLATQLREELRAMNGGSDKVCENEACQQQLRAQVRECAALALKQGALGNAAEAKQLGSAMLGLAAGAGDPVEAGELVRAALQHQWKLGELEGTAHELGKLENRNRWQHETMKTLRECAGDGTCSGEQAQVSAQVMAMASRRADADPREAGRVVRETLRVMAQEQAAEQNQARAATKNQVKLGEGEGEAAGEAVQARTQTRTQAKDGTGEAVQARTQTQAKDGTGEALQTRTQTRTQDGTQAALQTRTQTQSRLASGTADAMRTQLNERLRTRLMQQLQLRDGDDAAVSQDGNQMRYRYRNQVQGEARRGGSFGGKDSNWSGSGFGPGGDSKQQPGTGTGTGSGPQGPGGH